MPGNVNAIKDLTRNRPVALRAWIWFGLLWVSPLLAAPAAGQGFYPDWRAVPAGPFPVAPSPGDRPVLTKFDVTDAPAQYVADPFMMREGGAWYLFFEVYAENRGRIAVATSPDGLDWTYDRIVFDDGLHHSFPFVFKFDGQYYMLPESSAQESVRLYRATHFPYDWELYSILASGRVFVDPCLVRYGDSWWMFVGGINSAVCRLYYSGQLAGPWIEHPASPIVNADKSKARPAGRPFVYAGNRLIRLAQDCEETYGRAVRAFQVDQIDPQHYAEHEIPESPLVEGDGAGWHAIGMHTFDPWWVADHWQIAVDGVSTFGWVIGIYRTPAPASAPDLLFRSADTRTAAAGCVPNPFMEGTSIRFHAPGSPAGAEPRLDVLDCAGRRIRTLDPAFQDPAGPGPGTAFWDGRDAAGRPVSPGTYFCRLSTGGEVRVGRMVKVR